VSVNDKHKFQFRISNHFGSGVRIYQLSTSAFYDFPQLIRSVLLINYKIPITYKGTEVRSLQSQIHLLCSVQSFSPFDLNVVSRYYSVSWKSDVSPHRTVPCMPMEQSFKGWTMHSRQQLRHLERTMHTRRQIGIDSWEDKFLVFLHSFTNQICITNILVSKELIPWCRIFFEKLIVTHLVKQ
jgi:hypothetical protein